MQELERFIQIPSIDVQEIIDRKLNHIPALIQPKILILRLDIDETDVIIAVGRGETLGSAARFHSQQYPHMFSTFNLMKLFDNQFSQSNPSLLCCAISTNAVILLYHKNAVPHIEVTPLFEINTEHEIALLLCSLTAVKKEALCNLRN